MYNGVVLIFIFGIYFLLLSIAISYSKVETKPVEVSQRVEEVKTQQVGSIVALRFQKVAFVTTYTLEAFLNQHKNIQISQIITTSTGYDSHIVVVYSE